jgi:hypothetical protein
VLHPPLLCPLLSPLLCLPRYITTQARLSNLGLRFGQRVQCKLPDGQVVLGKLCRLLPPAGCGIFDCDISGMMQAGRDGGHTLTILQRTLTYLRLRHQVFGRLHRSVHDAVHYGGPDDGAGAGGATGAGAGAGVDGGEGESEEGMQVYDIPVRFVKPADDPRFKGRGRRKGEKQQGGGAAARQAEARQEWRARRADYMAASTACTSAAVVHKRYLAALVHAVRFRSERSAQRRLQLSACSVCSAMRPGLLDRAHAWPHLFRLALARVLFSVYSAARSRCVGRWPLPSAAATPAAPCCSASSWRRAQAASLRSPTAS